jgi:drug/metabolite transporter (DMT)-like permease
MSLALYIVGFLVLLGGLAMAAVQLGVPPSWIIIGIVVLTGIAIIGVASSLRNRLPPGAD